MAPTAVTGLVGQPCRAVANAWRFEHPRVVQHRFERILGHDHATSPSVPVPVKSTPKARS